MSNSGAMVSIDVDTHVDSATMISQIESLDTALLLHKQLKQSKHD